MKEIKPIENKKGQTLLPIYEYIVQKYMDKYWVSRSSKMPQVEEK
jgi:hypothetical protein